MGSRGGYRAGIHACPQLKQHRRTYRGGGDGRGNADHGGVLPSAYGRDFLCDEGYGSLDRAGYYPQGADHFPGRRGGVCQCGGSGDFCALCGALEECGSGRTDRKNSKFSGRPDAAGCPCTDSRHGVYPAGVSGGILRLFDSSCAGR